MIPFLYISLPTDLPNVGAGAARNSPRGDAPDRGQGDNGLVDRKVVEVGSEEERRSEGVSEGTSFSFILLYLAALAPLVLSQSLRHVSRSYFFLLCHDSHFPFLSTLHKLLSE